MASFEGYRPSGGVIPSKPTKEGLSARPVPAPPVEVEPVPPQPEVVQPEKVVSKKPTAAKRSRGRTDRKKVSESPTDIQAYKPPVRSGRQPGSGDQLKKAIGIALGHVRGSSALSLEVSGLILDESAGSEIIFRVGQALGPLGLRGTELAEAQERLAQIREAAEAVTTEDNA